MAASRRNERSAIAQRAVSHRSARPYGRWGAGTLIGGSEFPGITAGARLVLLTALRRGPAARRRSRQRRSAMPDNLSLVERRARAEAEEIAALLRRHGERLPQPENGGAFGAFFD